MAIRVAGPCQSWTPIWCEPLTPALGAISGSALAAATEVLWGKSGRQFDTCTQVLRPCAKTCFGNVMPPFDNLNDTGYPWPYLYAGQWYNLGCNGCSGECSCTVLYEAKLPPSIGSITQILIDGTVLPASSYTVYDYEMLIRTDGEPWPRCNDLNKADTEVGTWSITLTIGTEVPELGQLAVGELAREFALALCNDNACRLPSPVQSIVRQGVSVTFLDPTQVFADGKIGLYFSDLFISTFNPGGIAARAQVIDVDGHRARRRT